jgi:multidrug resistance protein
MYAPTVAEVSVSLGTKYGSLSQFSMSIYMLGFVLGPLVFSPLSDIYGRMLPYRLCLIGYVAFTVGCAWATNLSMLTAFRFFAGCFGAGPGSIGNTIVVEMYTTERRGKPMALYTLGQLAAPALGPVIGGVVAEKLGWRWMFMLVAAMVSSVV